MTTAIYKRKGRSCKAEKERNEKMNMMLIFDVIMIFLGAVILIQGIQMKRKNEMSGLFVPAEEMTKCKDISGFCKAMFPKVMIFGIISTGFGIQGLINDTVYPFGKGVTLIVLVVFIGAWIWFSMVLKKEKEKYLH